MKWVELKEITNNLDNKRIPLNSSQRSGKESNPLYPYIGANNIMGYIDEYIFDEKILCIAEDGGSWGKNETCAKIYNEKVWVNNHAHVITAKDSLVLEYLKYYLNFTDLNLYINGATRGKLTKSSLNSIQIPLPPLEQQKKIAAILDAADEYRQKTKVLIAKYDELTQSLFLDMFGDPRNNKANFPKLTMDEIADKITDGDHATPKRESTGHKLLSCRNIKNGYIDFSAGLDYVGEDEFNRMRKRCNPEYGDILISCSGTIGRATSIKTNEEFVLVRSAALVKIQKDKVNSTYMEYYLRTEYMQSTMQSSSKSSGQANLFTGPIKKLPIIIPPFNLQNQFAERVQAIEVQKAQAQASLEKAEDLFNSLLQRAFKGELV